jgi:tetratricopeptide (TPR) repeat protein
VPSRLLVLVILCLAAAVDTGTQPNTWRQCLADASPATIDACTTLIRSNPRNDGAYVNRGIAYRRLGDIDRAIHDYDQAIRVNPRAADAFNNRGNAFRARDEHGLAMHDYDEAIRLDPHYAHALNNRGIIFLEMGDANRSIADFDRAIAEDGTYANAFRNRGIAHADLGRFDRAIQDFDIAFTLNPAIGHGGEYALALYGRGLARQLAGDPAGLADIEQATRLRADVAEVMIDTDDEDP